MSHLTLGIDLGTNSIGWALAESDEQQKPQKLLDCGSRIFPEAVEAKTRTPKNRARREARGARRVLARRKQRRRLLLGILVQHGLLPEDAEQQRQILTASEPDPYALRARGVDDRLEEVEFARALYHLCQRRGFLSNRKARGGEERKKEEKGIKQAISQLQQEIHQSGARTLGQYLYTQPKKRCRHTSRAMYEQEFGELWKVQAPYHPVLLTEDLKVKIYRAIFFQRPLKAQKHLVGRCTFETSLRRASRAWQEAQRFRIWQDINNLEVRQPEGRGYRRLNDEERWKLFRRLDGSSKQSLTWNDVRKLLELSEGQTFNLEERGDKKLLANLTAVRLRKAFPKTADRPKGWDSCSPEEQRQLIEDLNSIQDPVALLKRLRTYWKLDEVSAEKVAEAELPPGYARLSLKAIKKLLPSLEKGMAYSNACQAAGYAVGDVKPHTGAVKLAGPPSLRNPVVQKALYEVRKVVNQIIRACGKPSLIRVELARDMKLTPKQKKAADKQRQANERLNEQAREKCQELGIPSPSRDDLLKYRLWIESRELCPYTGQHIPPHMLFSGDVDIEHILPYSQSLDDSYRNKTLCMAWENRSVKRKQTPYEAYSGDSEKYAAILQRVEHSNMSWGKKRKFYQEQVDTEQFVNRQLSDTRYISREVRSYLLQLGVPVEISKGEATAALRRRWGLNGILATDRSDVKNRADHRHHAIDAIVIALTSRALFQKLSRLSARYEAALSQHAFRLDPPWDGFRSDVEARMKETIVSHAPTRKIIGALHEETAYGLSKENEDGQRFYVYRKRLDSLTPKEIGKIRDKAIQRLVKQRIEDNGGDPENPTKELLKKAFAEPLYLPHRKNDGKTIIQKVRLEIPCKEETPYLRIKDDAGKEYKHYKLGSYHHVEIVENIDTGERKGRFVSTLVAARRARIEKVPIVDRACDAGWQFVMWLCPNDMIEIEEDGQKEYYRVQKMSGATETIVLRKHHVAPAKIKDQTGKVILDTETVGRLIKKPNTLRGEKASVDPLGEVRPCHD
ncbi:MAG: type II CRISPR RNA-guided endonuclease Cas9 [Acidobacteria bacterium]|nr:type II CRISPR RNA-guided endonuclease Cas9 [Acidobacteriota bacterium]